MLKIRKRAKLVGYMHINFGLDFWLQEIGYKRKSHDHVENNINYALYYIMQKTENNLKRRNSIRNEWNSKL